MKNPPPEPKTEYSQEEHDRLCTEVLYDPWTFERRPCDREAVATIGGQYVNVFPLRFCLYHWHDFRAQVTEEVHTGGVLEFVQTSVLTRQKWAILEEERARVRSMLKAEQDNLREQRRALRTAQEEQRRVDRDMAALAAEFTPGARVYFVQSGKRGPIKVGTAVDVLKRLDELQTGNPIRLRVRATVPGGRKTESAYHRTFAEHRLSGEWFKPVAAIRAEIDRINAIKRRGEGALF